MCNHRLIYRSFSPVSPTPCAYHRHPRPNLEDIPLRSRSLRGQSRQLLVRLQRHLQMAILVFAAYLNKDVCSVDRTWLLTFCLYTAYQRLESYGYGWCADLA